MGERRQDGACFLKRHRVQKQQQFEALWVWLKVCHTHFFAFSSSSLCGIECLNKEVTFEPSTPSLSSGVKRIVKYLEARGFRRTAHQCQNSVSFSRPEFCKSAYIGSREFSSTRAALNSTSSEMASSLQRNLDNRTRRRFVRR